MCYRNQIYPKGNEGQSRRHPAYVDWAPLVLVNTVQYSHYWTGCTEQCHHL